MSVLLGMADARRDVDVELLFRTAPSCCCRDASRLTGRPAALHAEIHLMMNHRSPGLFSRRGFLAQAAGFAAAGALSRPAFGQTGQRIQPIDATFLFIADVHACRMASGLSPNCLKEGKTDAALLRNVCSAERPRRQGLAGRDQRRRHRPALGRQPYRHARLAGRRR